MRYSQGLWMLSLGFVATLMVNTPIRAAQQALCGLDALLSTGSVDRRPTEGTKAYLPRNFRQEDAHCRSPKRTPSFWREPSRSPFQTRCSESSSTMATQCWLTFRAR